MSEAEASSKAQARRPLGRGLSALLGEVSRDVPISTEGQPGMLRVHPIARSSCWKSRVSLRTRISLADSLTSRRWWNCRKVSALVV